MKFFASILPAVAVVATFAVGATAQKYTAVLGSVNDLITQTSAVAEHVERVNSGNIDHQGQGVSPAIVALTENIMNEIDSVFTNTDPNNEPINAKEAQNVATVYQQLSEQEQRIINDLLNDYALFSSNNLVEDTIKAVREFRAAATAYTGSIKGAAEAASSTIMDTFANVEDSFEAFVQLYEKSG
ncbi:hypothetical protein C2E23DRAFT_279418 [Lenzites betulinus]|nr:hypothetical protein C2E23DRAFT_279418 [Lenzites betulinus]